MAFKSKPFPLTRPCPASSSHRRTTPLSADERRDARNHRRDGRSVAWIASHYGLTVKEMWAIVREKPRPKSKPSSPPNESEAVTA
jgi:hypothetical protein